MEHRKRGMLIVQVVLAPGRPGFEPQFEHLLGDLRSLPFLPSLFSHQ